MSLVSASLEEFEAALAPIGDGVPDGQAGRPGAGGGAGNAGGGGAGGAAGGGAGSDDELFDSGGYVP